MSSDLNKAIFSRLAGKETLTGPYAAAQQSLARLLASDADTGFVAVHRGNASDVSVYPAITFRESAGVVDKRFTMGNCAVGLVYVDNPIYDFESWGKSPSGTELSDIDDAFCLLLDQRRGITRPLIPNGLVDEMMTLTPSIQIYDDKRHAWCLLRRIQFKTRLTS